MRDEKLSVTEVIDFQQLTVARVAKYMGWGRRRLENIMAGSTWISSDERDKLAEAVGVTIPTVLDVNVKTIKNGNQGARKAAAVS